MLSALPESSRITGWPPSDQVRPSSSLNATRAVSAMFEMKYPAVIQNTRPVLRSIPTLASNASSTGPSKAGTMEAQLAPLSVERMIPMGRPDSGRAGASTTVPALVMAIPISFVRHPVAVEQATGALRDRWALGAGPPPAGGGTASRSVAQPRLDPFVDDGSRDGAPQHGNDGTVAANNIVTKRPT